MNTLNKAVKTYTKMFKGAISRKNLPDADAKAKEYEEKLGKMYESEDFKKHNVYPTMGVEKVYAVICICLTLKEYGLEKDEIIDIANDCFRTKKKLFACLEKVIDSSPLAWNVARKWNLNDYSRRVEDGSIVYDEFNAEENKISYRISGCKYVEMFDYYGIREYCKIFCMSDTQAYANLTRHVDFIRHSDLSDGDSCYDEILKKTRKK